jgi:hypothetical protein
MLIIIGFNNDVPRLSLVTNIYHPAILDYIMRKAAGVLHHPTKINLRKPAINHPLEQMWTELKLPLPP